MKTSLVGKLCFGLCFFAPLTSIPSTVTKAHNAFSPSGPVKTIVRRKERVIWSTSPQEKGRKWTGIVCFAWLYNETAVWACEKNESWLAQPLANRWVLRRWHVEPGEEAKEAISFHSAHVVNFPSQDLLDSPLLGQKVPGCARSQQPRSTSCCSICPAQSAPPPGSPSWLTWGSNKDHLSYH